MATNAERIAIAERIVSGGGRASDISRALRLNGRRARELHDKVRRYVSPPPPPPCTGAQHGTANAYRNHGCRCDTARVANTRYNKLRRAGLIEAGWVPSLGLVRRRQALAVLGYTWRHLAACYGCAENVLRGHLSRSTVRRVTFRRWAQMYDRLSRVPGPSDRARAYARRAGWAPPAAWDDIDNPRERPKGVAYADHLEVA